MKQYSLFPKMLVTLALTTILIGFSVFAQKQSGRENTFRKDSDTTSSGKRDRNGTDRDVDNLDKQMKQLEIQMKNLSEQMKNLDMSKYQKEINEAIKEIDVEKMTEQMDRAMKNIDWEGINKEVAESAKEASKVKTAEVKKQLEKVKADLQKQKLDVQIDREKIKVDIDQALKDARESVASAREEIKNVKEFTDALEKDGLIDKSKAYKLEVKDGILYINDKKQSRETSDKYKKYYKKGDFKIDMSEGDDFRI